MTETPIVARHVRRSDALDRRVSSPTPTDDEVVAIMAGVEALWPKAGGRRHGADADARSWRFSGRWWSRPVPARRDRPYR